MVIIKSQPQFMCFKYSKQMLDCVQVSKEDVNFKGLMLNLFRITKQKTTRILIQFQYLHFLELYKVAVLSFRISQKRIIIQSIEQTQLNKIIPIVVDSIFSQLLRCACDVSYNLPKLNSYFLILTTPKSQIDNHNGIFAIKDRKNNKLYKISQSTVSHLLRYRIKYYFIYGRDSYLLRWIGFNRKNKLSEIKRFRNIAIVSLFYFIGYFIAKPGLANQKGKPFKEFILRNAEPIRQKMSYDKN